MRRLVTLAACMATWLAAPAAAQDLRPAGWLSIEVQAGEWGNAHPRDIAAVLYSVAEVLQPHFPRHANARVSVAFSTQGPRVLARRSPHATVEVLLNVRDRRWDQFAYQFGHELCHVLSNYDERPLDPARREHQWFEETLCEAVAIVTLERLTPRWTDSPPHAAWASYAPAFQQYAARLLGASHRRLGAGESVARTYLQQAAALERDPYLRDVNERLATAIVELLRVMPAGLEAIGYLNLETPRGKSFAAYLGDWYACCPEQQRQFVQRVMSLFGVA